MRTTTERGYGRQHQLERARWQPLIDSGNATCTEPICHYRNRHIHPDTPWDLAHNRGTGGYRGPAHARCNRSEGAAFGNRQRGQRRHGHSRGSDALNPSRQW